MKILKMFSDLYETYRNMKDVDYRNLVHMYHGKAILCAQSGDAKGAEACLHQMNSRAGAIGLDVSELEQNVDELLERCLKSKTKLRFSLCR